MIRRALPAAALLLALALVAIVALRSGDAGDPGPAPRERTAAPTRAHALALERDGRAVALVERLDGDVWQPALARERDDRSLDEPFADVPVENPAALAVAGDGDLLVAGDRFSGGRRVLAVARLSPDGRLDGDFGADGVVTVAAGSGDAVARGLAVTSGGVVVVGDARDGERHAIAVARIAPDGSRPRVELIPGASAAGVAVRPDGRAIVAGTDTRDGRALLASPGGPLVPAPAVLAGTSWRALAVTPDGGAVVVGSGRDDAGRSVIAVQRFDANAAPAGSETIAAGDGDAHGAAVAVDRGGRVLVGGTAVRGDKPVAVVATLGSGAGPVTGGEGRLAGLAPGPRLLTTAWRAGGQRAALAR